MAARKRLLPQLVLLVLAAAAWHLCRRNVSTFVFGAVGRRSRHNIVGSTDRAESFNGHRQVEATTLRAKGGDSEADKIELGGFSGFVVGLALLPYVLNALVVVFGVLFSGNSFELGPFGLTFISCVTNVGITFWSIGSFFNRGKGLPAGPLGFLGLAEGLSYIGTLGLLVATVLVTARAPPAPTGVPPPAATVTQQVKTTPASAPITAPAIKVPDVKVPEIKAPSPPKPEEPKKEEPKKQEPKKEEPKKPEPKKEEPKKEEPKKPEVKAPEPKKEEPKKPEPKKEEPKKPEVKAPEPKKEEPKKEEPKKEEPKKPEVKAPEPKKEEPKKPVDTPNYDSLFD